MNTPITHPIKNKFGMMLATKGQYNKLVSNHKKSVAIMGGVDHPPVANCTWLISELNPKTGECFGLCDLGMGFPELGPVYLSEILTRKGALGLPVERDYYISLPKVPLSRYKKASGYSIVIPA